MTTIGSSSHAVFRSTITNVVAKSISFAGAGLASCGNALRSVSNTALSLLSSNKGALESPVVLVRSTSFGGFEFRPDGIDRTHGIAHGMATKKSAARALTEIRNELTHAAKLHALGSRGKSGGNISRDRSLASVAANSFGTPHILSSIQRTHSSDQKAPDVRLHAAPESAAHDFVYRGDDRPDEDPMMSDALSRSALDIDNYYALLADATQFANARPTNVVQITRLGTTRHGSESA